MNSQRDNGRSDDQKGSWMGAGIAIGAGWGVALGLVLGNLALGIAIGAALGSTIGALITRQQRHYRLAEVTSDRGRARFLAVGGLLLLSVVAGMALFLFLMAA